MPQLTGAVVVWDCFGDLVIGLVDVVVDHGPLHLTGAVAVWYCWGSLMVGLVDILAETRTL